MAKGATEYLHPHQKLAMGLSTDVGGKSAGDLAGGKDFGVGSVEGGGPHVNHMDASSGVDHSPLHDSARASPVKHGRRHMHKEGHAEHGPHHMNSGHKPIKLGGRGGNS